MSRGNPRGSQNFMGSLDSASEYCECPLWALNCSSPQAVMGGTGFSFGLAGPAQNPLISCRVAGPPVPFLLYWSTNVFPPSARIGLFGSRVCDQVYEEKNSTPASAIEALVTFTISPSLIPASVRPQLSLRSAGIT